MPRAPPSSLAKASELPLLSIGVEFIGPLWQLVFPLLQLLWRTGSTSVLNVTGVVVSPVDTYGVQLPGLPLLLPLLVLPLPLPLPLELPLDELSSPEHSIMPRRAVGVRRHTRMAIPRGDHEDKTLRCDTSIFFSFRCRCRAMLRRRRMVRDRSPPLHGRSPRVSGIAPGAAKKRELSRCTRRSPSRSRTRPWPPWRRMRHSVPVSSNRSSGDSRQSAEPPGQERWCTPLPPPPRSRRCSCCESAWPPRRPTSRTGSPRRQRGQRAVRGRNRSGRAGRRRR